MTEAFFVYICHLSGQSRSTRIDFLLLDIKESSILTFAYVVLDII